jgi:hypothetical protein
VKSRRERLDVIALHIIVDSSTANHGLVGPVRVLPVELTEGQS